MEDGGEVEEEAIPEVEAPTDVGLPQYDPGKRQMPQILLERIEEVNKSDDCKHAWGIINSESRDVTTIDGRRYYTDSLERNVAAIQSHTRWYLMWTVVGVAVILWREVYSLATQAWTEVVQHVPLWVYFIILMGAWWYHTKPEEEYVIAEALRDVAGESKVLCDEMGLDYDLYAFMQVRTAFGSKSVRMLDEVSYQANEWIKSNRAHTWKPEMKLSQLTLVLEACMRTTPLESASTEKFQLEERNQDMWDMFGFSSKGLLPGGGAIPTK